MSQCLSAYQADEASDGGLAVWPQVVFNTGLLLRCRMNMKTSCYRILSSTIVALSLAIPSYGEEARDEVSQRIQALERKVIAEMKRSMTCKSFPELSEANLYCSTKFRGLEIDFAGVNAPGGGMIYVRSMGLNQLIGNLSGKCLLVFFKDEDLTTGSWWTHIILRNDTVIEGYLSKSGEGSLASKFRKECQ